MKKVNLQYSIDLTYKKCKYNVEIKDIFNSSIYYSIFEPLYDIYFEIEDYLNWTRRW